MRRMPERFRAARALLLGGILLAGCAGGPDLRRVLAERERRIEELQRREARARSERQRAVERVQELEAQLALLRSEVQQLRSRRWETVRIGGERTASATTLRRSRRAERARRVEPPEPGSEEPTEAPGEAEGEPLALTLHGGADAGAAHGPIEGDLGVVDVPPAEPAEAAPPARLLASAGPASGAGPVSASGTQAGASRPAFLAAYRKALQALGSGRFEQALEALAEAERVGVPRRLRGAVRYWRAEALYGARRYREALAAFEAFLAEHGGERRAPDALWKVSLCKTRLGDERGARDARRRLIERYPGSMAARLAARDEEERS